MEIIYDFNQINNIKYDKTDPDTSNTKPHLKYRKYREQYRKLDLALQFDRKAALMFCSWGKSQIMGRYFQQAGCVDIEDFVNKIQNIDRQADIFTTFINNSPTLK